MFSHWSIRMFSWVLFHVNQFIFNETLSMGVWGVKFLYKQSFINSIIEKQSATTISKTVQTVVT